MIKIVLQIPVCAKPMSLGSWSDLKGNEKDLI